MDMIETVAKAIYEGRNGAGCKPWSRLPSGHKAPYLGDAMIALEAMREPTPEMIRARWQSYHPWGQNAPPPEDRQAMFDEMAEKTTTLWATMIDAALNPQTAK